MLGTTAHQGMLLYALGKALEGKTLDLRSWGAIEERHHPIFVAISQHGNSTPRQVVYRIADQSGLDPGVSVLEGGILVLIDQENSASRYTSVLNRECDGSFLDVEPAAYSVEAFASRTAYEADVARRNHHLDSTA